VKVYDIPAPHASRAYPLQTTRRNPVKSNAEETRIKTRRELLKKSLLSSSLWVSGLHRLRWPYPDFAQNGTLAGIIPFSNEGHDPVNELLGDELDGRLFTDLSVQNPDNPITSTDNFYIRTRASKLLNTTKPWSIQVSGQIAAPQSLPLSDLAKRARPMGLHLMECAGNSRSSHFGMLSVADWHGIPVEEILQSFKPTKPGARILISGFDRYSSESKSSVPGASWIFAPGDLTAAGAFLATKMNGQPLTPDHGFPIRLLVPNWYGCACIKWVDEISFVPDDAPATSQMQEYASRTAQQGVPQLAREYKPATLEVAAMPIRIEKWFVNGKIEFHVIGIQWGGAQLIDALEIQFNPDEPYVLVQNFHPTSTTTWNFWKQIWTPPASGRYQIRLRPQSQTIPARRLRSGYYLRSVDIKTL
jgi:DMSO/TMAO reductase YedYZ molybdopterin-dependent catalytic subunit